MSGNQNNQNKRIKYADDAEEESTDSEEDNDNLNVQNQGQDDSQDIPLSPSNQSDSEQGIENDTIRIEKYAQLLIYNLDPLITQNHLKNIFSHISTIVYIHMPLSKGHKRGFAFVKMLNNDGINNLICSLEHNLEQNDIPIQIQNIYDYPNFNATENIDAFSIKPICESDFLDEDVKTDILNEYLEQYKKETHYRLLLIFDTEAFEVIKQSLNDCTSEYEQSLLNILEYIAECITHFPQIKLDQTVSNQTLLYQEILRSGLIQKIEQVLKQRINYENSNQQINNLSQIEQLIRIYLLMMSGQDIKKDKFELCTKIITRDINDIIQMTKNGVIQEVNNMIESVTKILSYLNDLIRISANNKRTLTSELNFHKNISQLIHINCQQYLDCPNNINITISPNLQNLIIGIYSIIGNLTYFSKDEDDEEYSVGYNALLHLIQIFKYYSTSISIQQQQQLLQVEQPFTLLPNSSKFILATLETLSPLIHSFPEKCQSISSTPNLIQSLILLMNYKQGERNTLNKDKIAPVIRLKSFQCLKCIFDTNGRLIQVRLLWEGFIGQLSKGSSSAGGFSGNDEHYIKDIHSLMSHFFNVLYNGRMYTNPALQPLPVFGVQVFEQIEEEGGNEDIEAFIFNIGDSLNVIQSRALSIQITHLNLCMDVTNIRRRW